MTARLLRRWIGGVVSGRRRSLEKSVERVGAGGAIGFQRFHPADQITHDLTGALVDHLDVVDEVSVAAGVGAGEEGDAGIADPLPTCWLLAKQLRWNESSEY